MKRHYLVPYYKYRIKRLTQKLRTACTRTSCSQNAIGKLAAQCNVQYPIEFACPVDEIVSRNAAQDHAISLWFVLLVQLHSFLNSRGKTLRPGEHDFCRHLSPHTVHDRQLQ